MTVGLGGTQLRFISSFAMDRMLQQLLGYAGDDGDSDEEQQLLIEHVSSSEGKPKFAVQNNGSRFLAMCLQSQMKRVVRVKRRTGVLEPQLLIQP